jgi:hypothetical protein
MLVAIFVAIWAATLLVLTIVGMFVALHTVYWLTSPPLSPEAKAYEAQANALPTFTDNAYRVQGLLAPATLEPVAYGRCIDPFLNPDKGQEDKAKAGLAQCNQGLAPLSLPPALEQAKVSPAWTERDWLALARAVPDDTLLARAKVIAVGGPRTFGYGVSDLHPSLEPLGSLNLWHAAHAVALFQQGRSAEAVSTFEGVITDNLQSSDDTLIEAMTSVAGLSRTLLALQRGLVQSPSLDEISVQRLRGALDGLDTLPNLGVKAMDAEWRVVASSFDFKEMRKQLDQPGLGGWTVTALLRLGIREDSLNRLAIQFQEARQRMLTSAKGTWTAQDPSTEPPADPNPCPSLGSSGYWCYAVMPNPFDRSLLDAAGNRADAYGRYGIRIADVRNLAAATRLTLEVRRQQLSGEALAAFVATAPPEMRDVFTKQPFAYDPLTRKLSLVLRNKSPVLGEPGTYELTL